MSNRNNFYKKLKEFIDIEYVNAMFNILLVNIGFVIMVILAKFGTYIAFLIMTFINLIMLNIYFIFNKNKKIIDSLKYIYGFILILYLSALLWVLFNIGVINSIICAIFIISLYVLLYRLLLLLYNTCISYFDKLYKMVHKLSSFLSFMIKVAILIIILSILIKCFIAKYTIIYNTTKYAMNNLSVNYLYSIILLTYAILTTTAIIESYYEEIKNLYKFKFKNLDLLQLFSQNYLFFLSIVLSIPVAIIFYEYKSIYSLLEPINNVIHNYDPSSNFMTLAGVLGAIVSILISFSWLVIQTSTNNQNNILMWIWVRDPRFTTFVYVSFSTIFLLIILSFTRIPLHIFDFGIIYYIILLNFLMYVLYIKAFSTVINPKYTVDLILRFDKDKNENIDEKSDLTDAESRLLAVYDIIKKGIENKDVYLVVKCLNMIYKNCDDYWVFNDEKNIRKFENILYELYKRYMDNFFYKEPFFEKGCNAFKKLRRRLKLLKDYILTKNKINSKEYNSIMDCLNTIEQKFTNNEYWIPNDIDDMSKTIETLKNYLIELKKLYKNKCQKHLLIANKIIINKFDELINKCDDKLRELHQQ